MADNFTDTNNDSGSGLSPKDLFYHLFDELKGLNDTYIKYVFTTTATQILIIGWFMSDKAVGFIDRIHKIGPGIYSAIIFFVLIEIAISYYIWRLSKTTSELIKVLKLTEEKYFIFKRISGEMVVGMVLAHTVLYVLLGVIIYKL